MEQRQEICFIQMTADNVCPDGMSREVVASFACDTDSVVALRSSLEIRVAPPLASQNGSIGAWVGEPMSNSLAKFNLSLPCDASRATPGPVKVVATDHSAISDTERELSFAMSCEFDWDGEAIENIKLSSDPRIKWHNDSTCLSPELLPCELRLQHLNSILDLFGETLEIPAKMPAIPWEFPALSVAPAKPSSVLLEPAIQRNPQILHGAPSFPGSRVYVSSLLTTLMSGQTIDDFIEMFPSVDRKKAVAALSAIADETLTATK